MYASSLGPRTLRRGIVLVLVLGMLALMALIGVTFATFAGQALINGRNFSQGVSRPQSETLMDFALAQLINDTSNPTSAIRGHSLLRDMYGNDSVFRGNNPPANVAAEFGGQLSYIQTTGLPVPLQFTAYQKHPTSTATPFYNYLQYQTNIPINGPYAGLDFTRWIVRFPGVVPQSYEILEDVADATTKVHFFTLSANLSNPTNDPTLGAASPPLSSSDWTSFIYADPNLGANVDNSAKPLPTALKNYTSLATELNTSTNLGSFPSNPFVLDGRYMRAFNGPGLTRYEATFYPFNTAARGNFRLNGIDPDAIGMDEDYDACDLENWYLGIQSADGQVVIPSFHRPGILTAADWTVNSPTNPVGNPGPYGNPKILRPRQADNSPLFPADPSTPDLISGKLTYDVDNDGDGVSDSVWLDLGYPVQRDANGKVVKPLFAFMVLGLNGRLPLNTVGNLQARAIGNQYNTSGGGGQGLAPSTTQVPQPGNYAYTAGSPYAPLLSSQTYLDAPLWDHTSHLGYSVNEINPKFALQNAPANLYASTGNPYGITASPGSTPSGYTDVTSAAAATNNNGYTQYDDAGVSVALAQLRNLLAGTISTDIQSPVDTTKYTLPLSSNGSISANGDYNIVFVNGQAWMLPNGVADINDFYQAAGANVTRLLPAVAGRWGEPEGVSQTLPPASNNQALIPNAVIPYPIYWYNNPVRAGRSVYNSTGTNDIMDDDFDGTDPPIVTQTYGGFTVVKDVASLPALPNNTSLPANSTAATFTGASFVRTGPNWPEFADFFDNAGQAGVASERMRRFVIPLDPAGTGRVMSFMHRPATDYDYGHGADTHGRSSFFRYFRPPGMPQEIRYPYTNAGFAFSHYPSTVASGFGQQYLMPVLFPAGYELNNGPASRSDTHNNRLHGYQSMLTPAADDSKMPGQLPPPSQVVAAQGAMPFDWDQSKNTGTGDVPWGYGSPLALYAPTINPYVPVPTAPAMPSALYNSNAPVNTSVSSLYGPNLGKIGDPSQTPKYIIPYANYGTNSEPYGTPNPNGLAPGAPVVNDYLGGSLNKDEADEMNLYSPSRADMPYGPSDLEWLYRMHDVDGATLTSRLAKLAPISFLNPADGLTRRRLFSTDAWDLNSFAYANDNPPQYAGAAYSRTLTVNGITTYIDSSDHDFTYNSRFVPNASPSLEVMNQVALDAGGNHLFANFITTEFLPNPTFPPQSSVGNSITQYVPNSAYSGPITMPLALNPTGSLFSAAFTTAQVDPYTNLVIPSGGQNGSNALSSVQVQTPSIAHRDRKINLNFPLPISNDPAEPVRQKWCREAYQLLKAILPPASVDTPEELAALSQFVVNIVDFRDTDCTTTRFVNTDLEVTDVLTHKASNQPQDPFDTNWTVSPAGVRFATTNPATFPYDPGLYSPDPPITTFLVQHGMEYNPIALNEVMAYQAQYGVGNNAPSLTTYQAMFIELVNTLTEEQNNQGSNANSSAISLVGWDIVIAPDNTGWGRPDPISGDMNSIAAPTYVTNPMFVDPTKPPDPSQRQYSTTTDPNLKQVQMAVQQYTFTTGAAPAKAPIIKGITGGNTVDHFVIGDYRTAGTSVVDPTTIEGNNAVAKDTEINVRLPAPLPTAAGITPFLIPTPPAGKAQYYWVYLRRPANPFDVAPPNQVRPNKEMVVVDSMRFPVIDAATLPAGTVPPAAPAANAIYSAQRLQPYRGGHLVRVNTAPTSALPPGGATTISPPSPAHAYGYSEQIAAPPAGNGQAQYPKSSGGPSYTSQVIQQSINNTNGTIDTNWSLLPFHDRDFSSVAELLQVPGCPPGLFTKQFVEEPYPGNILDAMGNPATGTDDRDFGSPIVAPNATANPSQVGRKDFAANPLPANPTFPYLPDNFYYTAASVAPPASPNASYTAMTTEIGGWTGAGWHKMLEFFEVPSSANGAIGTADAGTNYDWARADLKPGQINLNLIIDEEVFAGLIDDPRMLEALATSSSILPFVVTQIDGNGYPAYNASGQIIGRSPIFGASVDPTLNLGQLSVNLSSGGTPVVANTGRGYVLRDPDLANYDQTNANFPLYQQVHGLKAAFSDFLKLRHGGSGYLFGFGAGPTGSGDFFAGKLTLPLTTPTHPLAAERPYRSLSYPDINYTILRPASLPPSPKDSNNPVRYSPSSPPLPSTGALVPDPGDLTHLFQYANDGTNLAPYVTLNPVLAPRNEALQGGAMPPRNFPYVQDPGIKNPFLGIQFVNKTASLDSPAGTRHLGPPYASQPPSNVIQPAPFPPPIPPTPARRTFQIPDMTAVGPNKYTSNASLLGQVDIVQHTAVNTALAGGTTPTDDQLAQEYPVNQPTITQQLSTLPVASGSENALSSVYQTLSPLPARGPIPPSLFDKSRPVFTPDNYKPQLDTVANNFLGLGYDGTATVTTDHRQHPTFRTELLQKVANLTTVRTHQFAVWITVGFFEVVRPGTAELGITDILGQEVGSSSGNVVRYRSFFVVDRTKATGFNPYYPGNFRDCVTYRRRIE